MAINTSTWKTKVFPLQGGTRFDIVPIYRDQIAGGTLIDSQNFQTGAEGGYQRIKGFAKYDSSVVPGSGRVLGCFVFNDGVVACRGSNIYFGTGSGWGAAINPSARTSAGQYRAAKYRWSSNRITLVDGVNYPVRYDATSGVATDLSAAPQGATCVWQHKNYLFFGKGSTLTQSQPSDDTAYSSGSGGATYVLGDTITGLRSWRDALYIFCKNSIHKLTGSSNTDFTLEPVTLDIGCNYPDTIQEVAGDLLFLAPDGLRPISGTSRIGDVNIETVSNAMKSYIDDLLAYYTAASDRICATVIDSDSQYRLFFSNASKTVAQSQGMNACLRGADANGNGSFEFFKLLGIQVGTADHGVTSAGNEVIIHADYTSGYVYNHASGDNFDGSNISAFIQSPYYVFDDPAVRKTIYKLTIHTSVADDAITNLVATVSLDEGDITAQQPPAINMSSNTTGTIAIYGYSGSVYGTSVYGQGAPNNYKVNLIGSGFNMSVKIASNDTLPQYTLKTLVFTYAMEARQ